MNSSASEFLRYIPNFLSIIPQILLLIGCIIYVSKMKSDTNGMVMLIGKILIVIVSIFSLITIIIITKFGFVSNMQNIYLISSSVSLIGSLLFSIGFLLVMVKIGKK